MVLFIIGILLIAVAIWGMVDILRKKRGPLPLMALALAVGWGLFIAGFFLVFGERLPPPEPKVYTYPAVAYRLKLRVTEYDGKRDTTYVFEHCAAIELNREHFASEYRLQLRIVEFEGQRDTTYVLVEKIKEYERCQ